jgi:hypothetical protein
MAKRKNEPESLKGWNEIARFLGQPLAAAQRWAKSGMPVEKRGRYVYASPDELNRWLGRESAGEPVQIATEGIDLGSGLKRGLAFVRKHRRGRTGNKKAA